jgi:flagellar hook-associated protein 1 FlgK
MSLLDALSVGRTAIRAASSGIAVTSHNVSNAMTPGFGRQRVELKSAGAHATSGGLLLGSGAAVRGFQRATDTLLGVRQASAAADHALADTLADLLEGAEIAFDETSGDGPALATSAFFDALDAASVDPSDPSLRGGVVAAAVDLGATIASSYETLTSQVAAATDAIEASAGTINALLAEVAAANASIAAQGASADTLDTLDAALRGLAELTGATASQEADGTMTVYVGGHAAVSGSTFRAVEYDIGSGSPRLLIETGGTRVDLTGALGGSTAGNLAAVDEVSAWLGELDAFAEQFASLVNGQLAAGFDLAGAPGAPLFTVGVPPGATLAANSAMIADPSLLAFSSDPAGGSLDGGNLVLLAALAESPGVDGQSPESFLAALASRAATATSSARLDSGQASTFLTDLDALQSTVSGVDLDEEAANLIVWQAAYQAAAAVVKATDETLSILMEIA